MRRGGTEGGRRGAPCRAHLARVALAACALIAATSPLGAAAADPLVAEYVRALGLAAAGEPAAALDALARLAEENPAWVAVHDALARVAIEAGGDAKAEWGRDFARRVRRSRRDVGASIAHAVFLAEAGRRDEAHRMLLSAVTAGARSPLLAERLLETSPDPDGLAVWLARRASVLPGDAGFAATRAGVLARIGRAGRALEVVKEAQRDAPQDPGLLAMSADLLRAAGQEREACRAARLAAGLLGQVADVPEIAVPRQIAIARAFVGCGRLDDAQRVLASLGPVAVPPGGPSLAAAADAAEAELEVERLEPLRALARLHASQRPSDASRETDARTVELVRAVVVEAHRLLGRAPPESMARAVVDAPLPAGLALVDRGVALASIPPGDDFPERMLGRLRRRAADALAAAGLGARAARLGIVAAEALDGAGARVPAGSSRDPTLAAATALVSARRLAEEGDAEGALRAARPSELELAGAPGRLRAALRVVAGSAALDAGQPEVALEQVREGTLDLQEADRSHWPVPTELRTLVDGSAASGDLASDLAGIAFRAERERGSSADRAVETLVSRLARAARGWSTLPTGWPERAGELAARVPPGACLVLSSGDGDVDSAALARGAEPFVGTRSEIADSGPCASADAVLWLGPASAPGGLTVSASDARPLVRLVGLGGGALRGGAHRLPAPVGAGPPRPLRSVVERVAGGPGGAGGDAVRAGRWPVFTGRGVRSDRSPLSSGWLVAGGSVVTEGWAGPESIAELVADGAGPGEGLVALGLRELGGPGPARGAWVLAEAAIAAGRPWALLSRTPLGEDEVEPVLRHLGRLANDLPRGISRLAREEPELAARLELWTLPGGWSVPPQGRGRATTLGLTVLAAAALVAGGVLAARRVRARRRRRR